MQRVFFSFELQFNLKKKKKLKIDPLKDPPHKMIFGLLDFILKFSIFSDFCRSFMILALFRLILHQFWANELPKILIFIK